MVKILQLANDRNPDVQLQIFFISKTIFFFSSSYIMHYVCACSRAYFKSFLYKNNHSI